MLERLKELFSHGTEVQEQGTEVQEVSDSERLHVATCVILTEVATADEEFSALERDRIVATLRNRFGLSEAEAEELMDASAAQRGKHHDLWHFTRQINEACTVAEKMHIIEEVWRVIYADGTLEAHEDYLVHKLAKLLNLNHPQLIKMKMKAKNAGRD